MKNDKLNKLKELFLWAYWLKMQHYNQAERTFKAWVFISQVLSIDYVDIWISVSGKQIILIPNFHMQKNPRSLVIIEEIITDLFVCSWQNKAALLRQRSLTTHMSASDLCKGQAIVWN